MLKSTATALLGVLALAGCGASPLIEHQLILEKLEPSHQTPEVVKTTSRPEWSRSREVRSEPVFAHAPAVAFKEYRSAQIATVRNDTGATRLDHVNRPLLSLKEKASFKFDAVKPIDAHSPINITGVWRSTACGSILQIDDSGTSVRISVVQSNSLASGDAFLTRDEDKIIGTARFCLKEDWTRKSRMARLELETRSADFINVETDRLYWDADGTETHRRPIRFALQRI